MTVWEMFVYTFTDTWKAIAWLAGIILPIAIVILVLWFISFLFDLFSNF